MNDDESGHTYIKHIHLVLYEFTNFLKQILIWNRQSI
jgi:hypothetical protein